MQWSFRALKPRVPNPEPRTQIPKPETRNPKPEIRHPKPEPRNPKPYCRFVNTLCVLLTTPANHDAFALAEGCGVLVALLNKTNDAEVCMLHHLSVSRGLSLSLSLSLYLSSLSR